MVSSPQVVLSLGRGLVVWFRIWLGRLGLVQGPELLECVTFAELQTNSILVDKILHHFEPMGHHCLFRIRGSIPWFLKWCSSKWEGNIAHQKSSQKFPPILWLLQRPLCKKCFTRWSNTEIPSCSANQKIPRSEDLFSHQEFRAPIP